MTDVSLDVILLDLGRMTCLIHVLSIVVAVIPFHPHAMDKNINRLSKTLEVILKRGKHVTTPLNRHVMHGKTIWREWHLKTGFELASTLMLERASKAASLDESCSPVHVYNVTRYVSLNSSCIMLFCIDSKLFCCIYCLINI